MQVCVNGLYLLCDRVGKSVALCHLINTNIYEGVLLGVSLGDERMCSDYA